ncbi:unnamed protein product [Tetraodon nigroviridis]|uniref:(spotted green pufferfish) hypothetical protein n=1 Tax=Tetraodon nigroviridis TaxID=99883 RepID=Q4T617_TETNG|nr:unnamed protein product [Tetraodon nigroviridis]
MGFFPDLCTETWTLLALVFVLLAMFNNDSIDPYGFLTFGTGPRACIGMRLSILIMKLALVEILQHFSFASCKETDVRKIFFSSANCENRLRVVCDCLVRLSDGLLL